jgi:arylsulfatase A-like enzyme
LIIFITDNGGPTAVNSSRNDPLRGFKAQVWEGGVRVPFLMQWKGRLPAGKTYDRAVISLDILPTALAAAEGKVSDKLKLDGVNLLPYLTGKNDQAPHELLFWRFGAQWAVRKGDWKLTNIPGQDLHLADLAADIGQSRDLAAQKPEVVKALEAAYRQWNTENVEPLVPKKKKMKETSRTAAGPAGTNEGLDSALIVRAREEPAFEKLPRETRGAARHLLRASRGE